MCNTGLNNYIICVFSSAICDNKVRIFIIKIPKNSWCAMYHDTYLWFWQFCYLCFAVSYNQDIPIFVVWGMFQVLLYNVSIFSLPGSCVVCSILFAFWNFKCCQLCCLKTFISYSVFFMLSVLNIVLCLCLDLFIG